MNEVWVHAVGIAAAGLPDWKNAAVVLLGERACSGATPPVYAPQLLPPNERRRATLSVRQAFQAAENAIDHCGIGADRLAAVFASSDADLAIIQRISMALTETARAVSPTDFHNSVHNAAAGYWSIATASRLPSTTICAYDFSFASGLVEAATMIAIDGHDTLLVAYDVPGPPLLQVQRPFIGAAGVALVLGCTPMVSSVGRLRLAITSNASESSMEDPVLEALRLGNPALRALPLLRALALGQPARVVLALPGETSLQIDCFAP